MNILGSVGQLYMFALLVLLFLSSGFAIWRFINFLMERGAAKSGSGEKPVLAKGQEKTSQKDGKDNIVKGGFFMANNGWIKLAVVSFVGIIISVAVLGLVSPNGSQGMNMNGQMSMGGQQGVSIHQQHVQQGLHGNANTQGVMDVNAQMGNMQMQGMVGGNMQMPVNGYMPMNGGMQNNYIMLQQQLQQLQMQLYQMQQQMGMLNGNMQMQQNGMSNMGGMGMMNGMMGGMSNMQQNNMNNMQQNNTNNMQQNNSGSNGGGMGMM